MNLSTKYGRIILKNDIDMVLPLVIWIESHECSYKIGHVMRQVFSKVVKINVYHFSWQPVRIRGLQMQAFIFFEFSLFSLIFFKMGAKWAA